VGLAHATYFFTGENVDLSENEVVILFCMNCTVFNIIFPHSYQKSTKVNSAYLN